MLEACMPASCCLPAARHSPLLEQQASSTRPGHAYGQVAGKPMGFVKAYQLLPDELSNVCNSISWIVIRAEGAVGVTAGEAALRRTRPWDTSMPCMSDTD